MNKSPGNCFVDVDEIKLIEKVDTPEDFSVDFLGWDDSGQFIGNVESVVN